MTAATQDRATPSRDVRDSSYPVGAAKKIYAGTLVAMATTGYAEAATATAANKTLGVANAQVNNSAGAAGALKVEVLRGVYRFANSASTDLITLAEVGSDCYVVDDSTVAKTNNSSARPVAGRVIDVDSAGVWVRVGY